MTDATTRMNRLRADLAALCAAASTSERPEELTGAAQVVAHVLAAHGCAVETITPAGAAPIVIGTLAGASPYTLLLHHHYDVAATGPWRAWHHEPFQLAERDNTLFGRGVAAGKGPLAAHLAAIAALRADGELPCGVVFVVEGSAQRGSVGLADALATLRPRLRADACLAVGGDRNASGVPFCYSGSKGTAFIRLHADGAHHALPPGLSASVPNPLWQISWALGQIKNSQEELLVTGLYDAIEGPTREESQQIRAARLDEAGRQTAWGLPAFLFEASGAALVRAESLLPTCNVSAISVEPVGDAALIPTAATARLDLQLVPEQQPATIAALIQSHLHERELPTVAVELLPGGYPAARTPADAPFLHWLRAAVQSVHGAAPDMLPLGSFARPLRLFADTWQMPVGCLALARPTSAEYGPNEQISLDDLSAHTAALVALLRACGQPHV